MYLLLSYGLFFEYILNIMKRKQQYNIILLITNLRYKQKVI